MKKVVIVTHWLDGDVVPFVRIGTELKNRGYEVILITHCKFEHIAREAGLDFDSWDTAEECKMLVEDMQLHKLDDVYTKNYSFSNSPFRQKYENNERRLKEYYTILKHCSPKDTVIVCKNRSSIAAYIVAEKMNIPLATVMMNPSEISNMLMYETLEAENDVDRLNKLRESVDLPPIKSWLQWESSAKMTLALWPQWYDSTCCEEWPSKIDSVGFPMENGKEAYNIKVPERFETWLSKNPRPIVISGGTTKYIKDDFYRSSISACALSGQPTVVLTRYKELLPASLPDNVVWYDYLPLNKILDKVSLLIHHGGIGTLANALNAGTPQLILPCYVDRPYNASIVKKFGVGDYLYANDWAAPTILKKIRSIQDVHVKEKCSQFINRMKNNHGITSAADKIEKLFDKEQYVYSINTHFRFNEPISKPRKKDQSKSSSVSAAHEILSKMSDDQKQKLMNRIRSQRIQ